MSICANYKTINNEDTYTFGVYKEVRRSPDRCQETTNCSYQTSESGVQCPLGRKINCLSVFVTTQCKLKVRLGDEDVVRIRVREEKDVKDRRKRND